MTTELATPRLILRQWRDTDRDAWHALNADPEVREFLGDPLTRTDSDAVLDFFRTDLQARDWGWPGIRHRSRPIRVDPRFRSAESHRAPGHYRHLGMTHVRDFTDPTQPPHLAASVLYHSQNPFTYGESAAPAGPVG